MGVSLNQVIQHQTVKYEVSPLSPLSNHRLSIEQDNSLTSCFLLVLNGLPTLCRYGEAENLGTGPG